MNKVYVLYCSVWGGSNYETEINCVYADEEVAHRRALELQGNNCIGDIEYRVKAVEFDSFVP